MPTLVTLLSRVDYPVPIKYNGQFMMMPPRGKKIGLKQDKLGVIVPSQIQIIIHPVE
jgi:hypothetical protein